MFVENVEPSSRSNRNVLLIFLGDLMLIINKHITTSTKQQIVWIMRRPMTPTLLSWSYIAFVIRENDF